MLKISQIESDSEISAVRELIREFTAWAISLEEGSENAPTFENLEFELETLPGVYAPPTGVLLLAMQDERPAGCIAFIGHDSRTCELKRLYVRPEFRGYKIGKKLVQTLLEHARLAGFERMELSSHHSMTKAHALYEAFGFRVVPTPEDFPENLKPFIVFMENELTERG